MWSIFAKKPLIGKEITLKISGMHCTSCATNIDLALEDIPGIVNADTNYQKMVTKVRFDPEQVSLDLIYSQIAKLGYQAEDEIKSSK